MRLQPGANLGPYNILGPIGAGGMGEVYRARDTRLGREVAVKVLPDEVTNSPERLARFEREARTASALNHRNIVTIHDFSSRAGDVWLVMELIRGESLRQLIASGPVPIKRMLTIAAGIADGLAAAHAAGIVHRDLKPENVMVTSDGTPKLLDFGLVKQTGAIDPNSPTATQMKVSEEGLVVGTASYMSPEQARGERIDFRTDIFSFGVMLHEMATGSHPFRRPSAVETLARIINDEPEPLPESLPEPFVWIVERCLAKNPAERYGSTADLAHDLANLRDRTDRIVARKTTTAPSSWVRGAFIAASAVAAIGLAALLLWPRGTPPAAAPMQVSVSTPALARVDYGQVSLPVTISPDGRYLLILGTGVDDKSGLWIHDLRNATTRLLIEGGSLGGWSADSRHIAYFADGKLKTIPVDGGPPYVVCDARAEGIPSWSGDDILYTQYSGDKAGLYRAKPSVRTTEVIVPGMLGPQFALPWWPHFLPNGREFFYVTIESGPAGIAHYLYVASLDGRAPSRIASVDSRVAYADGHLLFVRDATLLAQKFEESDVRLIGEPQPVASHLDFFKNTGAAAFSVSRSGVIAWRSALRDRRLVWLDRAGVELETLGAATFGSDGRLSPDGTRYVVSIVDRKTGISDLWVYDLARGSPQRLTFLDRDEVYPAWAPDGATMYHRSDGGGGPPDIFVRSPEGKSTLFYRGFGVQDPQDVSPDGKWLLFIDVTATGGDLNLLNLQSSEPRPFVATPFNEAHARFSPDGRWVSYTSDVSGRPEIYLRPLDGQAEAVRVSRDGGTRARWRRDGKELLFLAPRGRVMSVAVNADRVQAPRMLFQLNEIVDFDPTGDGSRLLVQLEPRTNEADIHLLVNWTGRLSSPN